MLTCTLWHTDAVRQDTLALAGSARGCAPSASVAKGLGDRRADCPSQPLTDTTIAPANQVRSLVAFLHSRQYIREEFSHIP